MCLLTDLQHPGCNTQYYYVRHKDENINQDVAIYQVTDVC